jgi:hypothetical protein
MTRITFDNEKEIRMKSLAGAAAINLLLLAVLLFVRLAQTVPNPPPIEFIEVNFGWMRGEAVRSRHITKRRTRQTPSMSKPPKRGQIQR